MSSRLPDSSLLSYCDALKMGGAVTQTLEGVGTGFMGVCADFKGLSGVAENPTVVSLVRPSSKGPQLS